MWQDYDPDDLKGQSEPTFSLDRALRAHKIDDDGIEMEDRAQIAKDFKDGQRKGTLDQRDPVEIAGDDAKYAELEMANASSSDANGRAPGSLKTATGSLKKRFGSLRHRRRSGD